MSKYKIWNKTEDIITPIGEVLSAEDWMKRYPVARLLDTVCGGSTVNGNIFAIYDDFIDMYEKQGCDFSNCSTKQDCLDTIEAFEQELVKKAQSTVSAEERTAQALEEMASGATSESTDVMNILLTGEEV